MVKKDLLPIVDRAKDFRTPPLANLAFPLIWGVMAITASGSGITFLFGLNLILATAYSGEYSASYSMFQRPVSCLTLSSGVPLGAMRVFVQSGDCKPIGAPFRINRFLFSYDAIDGGEEGSREGLDEQSRVHGTDGACSFECCVGATDVLR